MTILEQLSIGRVWQEEGERNRDAFRFLNGTDPTLHIPLRMTYTTRPSLDLTLQTVPNLFILSLSCSDIVVCCISATITPITAFRKEWIFGAALCRIAPFIAGISLCFSTFTLTAISIDRYMLIRFPMKKPLSHLQAMIVIGMICMLAACISSPIMFKQKLGPFENFCGLYCTGDFLSVNVHYGNLNPIIVLIFGIISFRGLEWQRKSAQNIWSSTTLLLIMKKITKSMILKGAKRQSSENWDVQLTDQQRMAVKRKQRTNRMLIAMVVAFSASWMWSVGFNVLRDYNYLPEMIKEQEYLFGIATHCVAMTSTEQTMTIITRKCLQRIFQVWNPLLYAMLNLQLRAAFIALLPPFLRSFLGVDCEKTSPLINGLEHPLHGTRAMNKYGSTSGQINKPLVVAVHPRSSSGFTTTVESTESRYLRRNSRKPSAIRVLVQKMKTVGDEEQELLISDSPDSPSLLIERQSQVLVPYPRRKSTACVRKVSKIVY
uniref:G_PROTEIN_RECEP_F1_2 domain-containing protein n=1 Tax=Heterorhabditis bacteriophora TaxID=37862 RepID=A0A1I7WPI5_HETBA